MNKLNYTYKIPALILFSLLLQTLTGCERVFTDFGNDRTLTGTVMDQSGNPVPGNISNNDLSVHLLGKGETQPTVIRVNEYGIYQNTKLFTQVYKVWVEGP